MINSLKDNIYHAIRSVIFSIIFPAPSIFSPRTMNYIGARGLSKLIPNDDKSRHSVYFDLQGQLYTSDTTVDLMQPDIFEAVLIKDPQHKNLYDNSLQYIIFIGGNTTCMEILLPQMIECYKNHKQVCVIGFNPPGVGMSPGVASFETNCAAPESIVKHLLEKNIPAENILFIGHSLGGSFASHIAAKYQIRVFIDRAMSSISDAAVAKILKVIPTTILRKTLGLLMALLTKIIIKMLHLEIDLVNNFIKINTNKIGSARAMAADGDELMTPLCCLVHNLPTDQSKHAVKFELHPNDKNRKSHSAPHDLLFLREQPNFTAKMYLESFINDFSNFRNNEKIPSYTY